MDSRGVGTLSRVPPTVTLPALVAPDEEPDQSHRSLRGTDIATALVFLTAAVVLTGGLWVDPNGRTIAENAPDQVFFEWVLSYTAHALTHGANPWFTHLLNAPLGVNIASNTAITAIAVALAPVTLLFGAPVSLVAALTLNLSLTAYAWYWLFSRHVTGSRAVAVAGGAFCGFAPGMVAHANGHLNFTAQFLIPVLLWRLVLLTRSRASHPDLWRLTPWRTATIDGAVIGALAAVQYAIAAELLFFTAVGVAIYVLAWALQRRRAAARIAVRVTRPLAVALCVAFALVAYPVWMQLFGPQTYHGTGFADLDASENLASFTALGFHTVGGASGGWTPLSVNVVEENTYFGPVLLLVIIACAARLCRRPQPSANRPSGQRRLLGIVEARALCWTALAIAALSLGSPLRIGPWTSSVPTPWALVSRLPLFDAALPGRLALLLTPIVALLLVATLDDATRALQPHFWTRARIGAVVVVGLLAIVPILPLPVPTAPRAALPRFITSGDWRGFLPAGTTVLAVPPATSAAPDGQRWQIAAHFGFAIEGGYFLGPGAGGRSRLGPLWRQTDRLLADVAATGDTPAITSSDRASAEADLAYWHTGLIVLPDTQTAGTQTAGGASIEPAPRLGLGEVWSTHDSALLSVCTELFGPPRHVDDVWLWLPTQR